MRVRFYDREGQVTVSYEVTDSLKPPPTIRTKGRVYDHRGTITPDNILCYYPRLGHRAASAKDQGRDGSDRPAA